MSANTEKKELILIQGNISESEVQSLSAPDDEVEISMLKTKGNFVADAIQVMFNDLNMVSFTRDFILSGLINISYGKVKDLIQTLKNRGKEVKVLEFEYEIQSEKNSGMILNIKSDPEKTAVLLNKIDGSINFEFINNAEARRTIFVTLDSNDNIEIQIL